MKRKAEKKMRRIGSAVLAAAVAVSLSFSVIPGVSADTLEEIRAAESSISSSIAEMQDAQSALEDKKADLQAQLDALGTSQDDALEKVSLLTEKINTINEQITHANEEIAAIEAQISQTQEELDAAEQDRADYYAKYSDRVRAMEENSHVSYLEILFEASSFSDLIDRYNMINEIVSYDNDVMSQLKDISETIQEKESELESEQAAAQEAEAQLESYKAELDTEQAEAQAALNEIVSQISDVNGSISSLEGEQSDLSAQIETAQAELEAKQQEADRIEAEQAAAEAAAAEAAAQAAAEAQAAEEASGSDSSSNLVITSDSSIVDVARSQIGNVGGEPYWSWYGFSYRVEWCACFVSWCANQCGYLNTIIPKYASCPAGVSWFQNRGEWLSGGSTPTAGMIIFFDYNGNGTADHTGIVEGVNGNTVYTIEGNSSDSCCENYYPISYYAILGYGVPAY